MAAAEWQAAAVLASMTPPQASNKARPERNEFTVGTIGLLKSSAFFSPDGTPLKEALSVFGNNLGDGESEEER